MIGAVHVLVGGAIGSILRKPDAAFAAGMVSHIVTDALPHRDLKASKEVPLIAGALGLVAVRYGPGSPEFAGAVGAILPDAEHGAVMAGLLRKEYEVFPTHSSGGVRHGRETGSIWPQLVISAVCLAAMEIRRFQCTHCGNTKSPK